MADAILVINAGSSSLKFTLFLSRGAELEPWLRGQAEGLYTEPAFIAKDADGTIVSEHRWKKGESVGHRGGGERAGGGQPPRAAPPAAQSGADQLRPRGDPHLAAGGVLRHRVPPCPAGAGPGLRLAEGDHRSRRAPLRLPRPLLRVHRRRAAGGRPPGGCGTGG